METSDELIESVAKAMCEADGFRWDAESVHETGNGEEPEQQREYWRDKAAAACSVIAAREVEAGAVKVKPLEWTAEDNGDFIAQSVVGWYHVGMPSAYWTVLTPSGEVTSAFETHDDAKAAAQADYERRILSAIASPAPHVAEGWVLVPIEPTETMLVMGACYEDQDHLIVEEGAIAGDIWRAMIAAAPKQGGNSNAA